MSSLAGLSRNMLKSRMLSCCCSKPSFLLPGVYPSWVIYYKKNNRNGNLRGTLFWFRTQEVEEKGYKKVLIFLNQYIIHNGNIEGGNTVSEFLVNLQQCVFITNLTHNT
mmetsp:Transcript_7332/g.11157  ORF Transcript_7332/g.11157 Transcript_7332/m.11157 type:complete len:109 (+) Transcript_7332:454-780(+)